MSASSKPCPNCAWAIKVARERKLTQTARWVFTNVAEFVNRDTLTWCGETCITMLADYTGLSREGVRQALAKIPADLLEVSRAGKRYSFKLLRTANDVDSQGNPTANDVDSDHPPTANDVDSPLPTSLAESPLSTPKKVKQAAAQALAREDEPPLATQRPMRAGPIAWTDHRIRPAGPKEPRPEDRDRPCVNGVFLDAVYAKALDASGIDPAKTGATWRPVIDWLADDIESTTILAAIRRVAARNGYRPPQSLKYFDRAVRERRAA